MAFTSTHFAGTNATKTSTVGAGVPSVYYSKRFMAFLVEQLRLAPFAQKRPLPEGNGLTAEFFRWRSLAPDYTELTEATTPDADLLYGQKVQAKVLEYGRYAQLSSLAQQAHIDTGLTGAVDIMAEQAANTMDGLCWRELCSNGCYPMPADGTGVASTFSGTLDSVTSTTILVDAGIKANSTWGDADHDLTQSVIVMTSGPAKGQSRFITAYTTAAGTITVSPAFDMTPEAGDTYWVATPDEITTGDDLSFTNMKAARTILKKYLARPYNGYFVMIIGPDAASNLMDDTKWQDAQKYGAAAKGLFDGEIGKFAGVRVIECTNPFIFPIAARATAGSASGPGVNGANFDVTGGVQTCLMFGKEAFGVTTFKKKGGQAIKPSIIIKNPGPNDTSNPMNRYGTVGWEIEIAHKSLYSLHCVGIWCAA